MVVVADGEQEMRGAVDNARNLFDLL